MIDPDFDPLQELAECRQDINNLYKNLNDLARAFNSQGHLVQKLINAMSEMQTSMAKELTYRDLIKEMDKISEKK